MANNVKETVKETVSEEINRVRDLSITAVKSKGYLYPIKGVLYYVSHRDLWKPLLSRLMPLLGLSASVIAGMFLFTYVPQVAILTLVNGPFAVFSTILLVLSESSAIITAISKGYVIQESLVDTFDAVLVSKDLPNIVSEGRELRSGVRDSMGRLGKMLKSPIERFSPKALIRYLMFLPLNLIPLVGTVIFVILQGKRSGPAAHARYFQLKKFSQARKEQFIEQNNGAYTSFGIVATLLELIPVASIFFSFTNMTGAALMAADMEKKTRGTEDATLKDETDRKEL